MFFSGFAPLCSSVFTLLPRWPFQSIFVMLWIISILSGSHCTRGKFPFYHDTCLLWSGLILPFCLSIWFLINCVAVLPECFGSSRLPCGFMPHPFARTPLSGNPSHSDSAPCLSKYSPIFAALPELPRQNRLFSPLCPFCTLFTLIVELMNYSFLICFHIFLPPLEYGTESVFHFYFQILSG